MTEDTFRSRLLLGAYWKTSSAAAITTVSVGAQIVLGFVLSEGDFGVYALAISVANLVQVVRDGGIRWFATRLDPASIPALHRRMMSYSGVVALVIVPVLLAAGLVGSRVYGQSEIVGLVAVLALAVPLGFYAPVGLGVLHAQLKFKQATLIELSTATLRMVGVVALAVAGFGPFSFVLPVLYVNCLESLFSWRAVRGSVRAPREHAKPFPQGAGRDLAFSTAGSWLQYTASYLDYLILGLFLPVGTLGFYFFGSELVNRVNNLLDSVRGVAIPAFAQRGVEPKSFGRVATLAVTVGGLLAIAVILAVEGVVEAIWQSKWLPSVGTAVALAAATPFFLAARLAEMAAIGQGRFELWAGQVSTRIIGVALGAYVGGQIAHNDPSVAAVAIAIGIGLSSIAALQLSSWRLNIRSARLNWATLLLAPTLVGLALLARAFVLPQGLVPLLGITIGLASTALVGLSLTVISPTIRRELTNLRIKSGR